jgi:hypothetical protein
MESSSYANDNFGLLKRHPRIAVRWMSKPTKYEQEQSNRDAARDRANKEGPESEREYIEHRLRELAAWERKISGQKN